MNFQASTAATGHIQPRLEGIEATHISLVGEGLLCCTDELMCIGHVCTLRGQSSQLELDLT